MKSKKHDTKQYVKDLFLAPVWLCKAQIVKIIFALIVLTIAQSAFLFLVQPFLHVLFQGVGQDVFLKDFVPENYRAIVVEYFGEGLLQFSLPYKNLIYVVPFMIFLAGFLKALAGYLYLFNQEYIAIYVAKQYRNKLIGAILSLSYLDIKKRSPGDWMSIVMNDVVFLQTRFSDVANTFVRGGVSIVSCLIVLAWINWPSALVIVCLAPFLMFSMGRAGKKISYFTEAFQRELARMSAAVLDIRSRFDFIRAQHGEEVERERFNVLNERYYKMMRGSIMIRSAFGPVLELIGFAIFAGFVFVIGHGYFKEWFNVEIMALFFGALGLLLRPLRDFGEQIAKLNETIGALRKSIEVFQNVEMIAFEEKQQRQKDIQKCKMYSVLSELKNDADDIISIKKMSVFIDNRTCFSYESPRDVLNIRKGKSIAIVGPSGAGKSTMMKSFAGLLPPDIWEATQQWTDFSSSVSMVSQDPFLFHDTLRENLIYGARENLQEDEIWEVLKTVHVIDEIKKLPQKLDTMTYAITANLSGGQIQRLVIARALLRKKPLLLLDEATSAIDAMSEKDILERLIDECKTHHKSLLAITHRMQWLDKFDEIWFLEAGHIRLQGNYKQLLTHERFSEFCSICKQAD